MRPTTMTVPGKVSGPWLARGEAAGGLIRDRSDAHAEGAACMLELSAASAGTCDRLPGEWSQPAGQGPDPGFVPAADVLKPDRPPGEGAG